MDMRGCIVQDTQRRKIIGRGTKKDGIYYVDQISHQGCGKLVRGSIEHKLWTWYRRLGHPSFLT